MSLPARPVSECARFALRDGRWSEGDRALAEETAIAFVVDGGAEAVMMASPSDLQDFAFGFALSEGLIAKLDDVRQVDIVEADLGVEVRLWLEAGARQQHAKRRRHRAGPAGCGLCGVESLEQALRLSPMVESGFRIGAHDILVAMAALAPLQTLNRQTRAVHAAAFYSPVRGIEHLREDVGRHNALDKLIGALAREQRNAGDGAILMTSRVSVELVQKAARIGAPVLAAVSAPTALALRTAEAAGISICGIVREDGLEVFTRPDRIARDAD